MTKKTFDEGLEEVLDGLENWEETVQLGLFCAGVQVKETWLATDYPSEMRSSMAQFRHAHTHIVKAAGKIAAVIDHEEHERRDREATEAAAELPKLFADIIRCTLKMGEALGIDVAQAYVDRANQLAERWGHAGPKLDPKPEPKPDPKAD